MSWSDSYPVLQHKAQWAMLKIWHALSEYRHDFDPMVKIYLFNLFIYNLCYIVFISLLTRELKVLLYFPMIPTVGMKTDVTVNADGELDKDEITYLQQKMTNPWVKRNIATTRPKSKGLNNTQKAICTSTSYIRNNMVNSETLNWMLGLVEQRPGQLWDTVLNCGVGFVQQRPGLEVNFKTLHWMLGLADQKYSTSSPF